MKRKLFAFVLAVVMSIGVIGNMNIVAFGETDESAETAKNADSLIVSVDKNIVGYSDARVEYADLSQVMDYTTYAELEDKAGIIEVKICTAAELKSLRDDFGSSGYNSDMTIYLANDIDMTGVTMAPIGTSSKHFTGTFDGRGYEISNFNITGTSTQRGLFGYVDEAVIKNVVLSGSISGGNQLGGIVACVSSGKVTIENCYNKANVTSTGTYIGGIVGLVSKAEGVSLIVSNCTNTGAIEAAKDVGGLVGGALYTTTVENCRNAGTVVATGGSSTNGCGAIVGTIKNQKTTITGCINNGTITKSSCATAADKSYGYKASGIVTVTGMTDYSSGETVDTSYEVAVTYADTLIGNNAGSNRRENAPITEDIVGYSDARVEYVDLSPVMDFTTYKALEDKSGITKIKICTGDELKGFRTYFSDTVKAFNSETTIYLANDIDMTGISMAPIGTDTIIFTGTFDGQGYEISNLTISKDSNYRALFGYVENATIKNVILSGNISGKGQSGGIVGHVEDGNVTVDNCYNKASVTSSATYAGGIAALVRNAAGVSLTVSNCTNTGAIEATADVGGLVGGALYKTSITNSRNIGTVTATAGTTVNGCGGIVGIVKNETVTVSKCINNGAVTNDLCTKTNDYVGYVIPSGTNAGACCYICYYEDISEYRDNDKGHEAPPAPEGSIFAGWFTDQACDDAIAKDRTAGAAYAKFVDEKIMTVKAQITSNLVDAKADNDTEGAIRFVTTVDSLKYSKIGFKVSYDKGDGNGTQDKVSASNKVYTKLFAVGTDANEDKTYVPKDFCVSSQYFKACTVRKVTEDLYGMQFTVTPFWTTQDGTEVLGEPVEKMVDQAMVRNAVYVATTGTDAAGYGTSSRPYQSLGYAMDKVAKTGTIYIKDSCSMAGESWEAHGKNLTITSADASSVATLDFWSVSNKALQIKDAVTFDAITLVLPNTVYANGNALTIAADTVIKQGGSKLPDLYGGSSAKAVAETNLTVHAGNYAKIYGGGYAKNVNGDTNITIGGKVNQDIDEYTHGGTRNLYGGSVNGTVKGNTNIKIVQVDNTRAKFDYIYGGGYGSDSVVSGTCNIEFDGIAESINGGCSYGACNDTYVTMTGGYVEQIFGGSDNSHVGNETDKNASANVSVLAGTVKRRIYGGCYNELDIPLVGSPSWTETYQVYGNTNVTLGPDVEFLFDFTESTVKADNSLYAISRGGSPFADECGTFIVNDKSSYKYGCQDDGYINYKDNYSSISCHYLVTTNGNTGTTDSPGTVTADGNELTIVPAEGYKATVTVGDENTTIYNEEGIFTLQTLTDSTSSIQISIQFEEIEG